MEPELHGLAPSYSRVSLAIVTSGREANLLGNIHGGEIMKLADSTGLVPETPDEFRWMREAEIRRAHRLARRREIDSGRGLG